MVNPLRLFQREWNRLKKTSWTEPTSMTLATADQNGRPAARVVLLKDVSKGGLVFYTNGQSRKGRHLRKNKHAALCFFWPPLDLQVNMEGPVARVNAAEADAYWKTRPRISQLGAWASHQSEPLKNRAELMSRLRHFERLYAGKPVPRPAHWDGFRLIPTRMEFWRRGEYRLHRRTLHVKTRRGWRTMLLNP